MKLSDLNNWPDLLNDLSKIERATKAVILSRKKLEFFNKRIVYCKTLYYEI